MCQADRVELRKHPEVVCDHPEGGDETVRDREDVDRTDLDAATGWLDVAEWRCERAGVPGAEVEREHDAGRRLDVVDDLDRQVGERLLQRARPIDERGHGRLDAVDRDRVGVELAEGRFGIGASVDRLLP